MLLTGLLFAATGAFAAERITYEDYQKQLQAYQAREAAALTALGTEKQAIADLKARIADIDAQIAAAHEEINTFLGVTREQIEAFGLRLDEIEARVDGLARLSPEQLLARAGELDEIAAVIAAMMKDPVAKLKVVRNRLTELAGRVEALKASVPRPKRDQYTVLRGDYLWKISGKKDIYGDPWKWLRIWSYNRTEIKNPDLIYPAQQLAIPRQLSQDEYLIKKGDSLKRIAARPEVYGDPFQWTKLYQANKTGSFLSDPNLIYPEQILAIPRH